MRMLIIVLAVILPCAVIVSAETSSVTFQAARIETQHGLGRVIEADADVSQLVVVKSAAGICVARFAGHPLLSVAVGDRIGRTHALVKEIIRGRVVLEETFTGADGKPNLAEIIIKDGEKGGTRYLQHPDEKRPTGLRPVVVDPPPAAKQPAK